MSFAVKGWLEEKLEGRKEGRKKKKYKNIKRDINLLNFTASKRKLTLTANSTQTY